MHITVTLQSRVLVMDSALRLVGVTVILVMLVTDVNTAVMQLVTAMEMDDVA